MDIFQTILLGILQGITEFLPISSSGQLVIVPHLLGWQFPPAQTFISDVLVQRETLFAVVVYFWHDLADITRGFLRALWECKPLATFEARLGWYLILATILSVVLGLLLKHAVESAFASPRATGFFLLGTALIFILAEVVGRRDRSLEKIIGWEALWIGLAQVLALFPGVSRSGATIAGGMTRHLGRPFAARFSFLMSVPVMIGAGAVALTGLAHLPGLTSMVPPLFVGFLTALASGYLAIRWLLAYLTRHSPYVFAAYCLLLGIGTIVMGA